MDTEEIPVKPNEPTAPVQAIYYGNDELYDFTFPDGVTTVTCKVMTEGDRQRYQAEINADRDVMISRQSGNVHMKLSTGVERMALLNVVIQGWNLLGPNGQPAPFSKGTKGSELSKWVAQAPPSLIDAIEKEIRKHETWLIGDATVEELDQQIKELQELRDKKAKEDEGNVN